MISNMILLRRIREDAGLDENDHRLDLGLCVGVTTFVGPPVGLECREVALVAAGDLPNDLRLLSAQDGARVDVALK